MRKLIPLACLVALAVSGPAAADAEADARAVIAATLTLEAIESQRPVIETAIFARLGAVGKLSAPARRYVARDISRRMVAEMHDRISRAMVPVMLEIYSEEELAAAAAFAATPAGGAYLAKSADASRAGFKVGAAQGAQAELAAVSAARAALRAGDAPGADPALLAELKAWASQ